MGLLVWYLGSGDGNGNPYGVAAAFGVFLVPVVFARINAPPAIFQPLLLFNVRTRDNPSDEATDLSTSRPLLR